MPDGEARVRLREIDPRELFHDALGERLGRLRSSYDTARRVEVLVDEFLGPPTSLQGKKYLDVGCGLGDFSERLVQLGATVVACDIGPSLVERTRGRVGCDAMVADALRLADTFGVATVDGIVSSECIEHTPAPMEAIRQMALVLRPGGLLSLSTPNRIWQPTVTAATKLGLRSFLGLENFSSWREMRTRLAEFGLDLLAEKGLHLFPFQTRLYRLLRLCDDHLQALRPLMINICVLARRNERPVPAGVDVDAR